VDRDPWRLITDAFARARSAGPTSGRPPAIALRPPWSRDCVRAWNEVAEGLA
jgi:hypothetical protein